MGKVSKSYHELVKSLTKQIEGGDRDIDKLVNEARQSLEEKHELTPDEIAQVTNAVRRDVKAFANSYSENSDDFTDSVFMRVIKESVWQELADITDKSQIEWREAFQDIEKGGVYQSGELVGFGNLICDNCHFSLAIYSPEILSVCPQCGHDRFHRKPFDP
ncbi:zinc ribbon-containing protein [Klebsiella sp. BIGb0407]|uniref:zinc ribbon-containing protein n=1 Tax=Klebsiella sp. BIGb0407 TaxID=2940603 RepID=UPI0021670CF6|nr:zinc ribbon-containing protein [Klebsiella sp. BIGb0407]MCS3432128.1 rubrerythrin [Klebsiella sp. BIGb0407]